MKAQVGGTLCYIRGQVIVCNCSIKPAKTYSNPIHQTVDKTLELGAIIANEPLGCQRHATFECEVEDDSGNIVGKEEVETRLQLGLLTDGTISANVSFTPKVAGTYKVFIRHPGLVEINGTHKGKDAVYVAWTVIAEYEGEFKAATFSSAENLGTTENKQVMKTKNTGIFSKISTWFKNLLNK